MPPGSGKDDLSGLATLIHLIDSVRPAEDDGLGPLPDPDDRHVDMMKGDDFVTYEGLVDMAHRDGLRLVHTEPVVKPTPEAAIFRAIVVTDRGVFVGYGDADTENTNDMTQDALIRVAETRAKARAMRDAVNVGTAALAELKEGSEDAVQTQVEIEET